MVTKLGQPEHSRTVLELDVIYYSNVLFYYSKLLSFEQLTKHKDHGRHKLKPIPTASAESHPGLLHDNVILEQFFYEILPSIHE